MPLALVTNLLPLKAPLASVTRFDFDYVVEMQIRICAIVVEGICAEL
jgi:hypothetical protein